MIWVFQVTPLHEGRPPASPEQPQTANFKSRPYTRGDLTQQGLRSFPKHFKSRPYTRGDSSGNNSGNHQAYFKSRPYTRGDDGGILGGVHIYISSHAPTRGATGNLMQKRYTHCKFQVTPLHEGRHIQSKAKHGKVFISSHAPTRGATRWRVNMDQVLQFQVTPLHEGRRF